MKIKLLSLNIFRYYQDWETRKLKILKFINEVNPDIVFLQECFDDSRHNKLGDNQGIQLNKELGFNSCLFSVAEKIKSEGGKDIDVPAYDGLCVLTNLPITKKKDIMLKQAEDDKHIRIVQNIVVEKNNQNINIFHTHFSNRDDLARNHLIETIEIAKQEPNFPIILGDLNIRIPEDTIKFSSEEYKSSWEIEKYISFPSKGETLDYALIPKKNYTFDKISCLGEDLSDHKALLITLSNNIN